MRKGIMAWAALVVLSLGLGGCTWLWPRLPAGFPEEIVPGWEKEEEAPIAAQDLPTGATGALGAVWGNAGAWLWVWLVDFGDPAAAHECFSDTVTTFVAYEESDLGNEGVTLVHGPSGLVLEFFRIGPHLLLVGSLADSPEQAPSPELVRQAAQALVGQLPKAPAAEAGPAPGGTCTPPEDPYLRVIEVPLELPHGAPNGTVTLVLETVPLGTSGTLCYYKFNLYLKCIELGPEDGDGPFRGPGDLFLAGNATLPCGELRFLTGEVAKLDPGNVYEFEGNGLLLGSQECLAPCGLANFPVVMNLVLRNHNQVDLVDLLGAFLWALKKQAPEIQPLWETAEGLSQAYGPEPGQPEDPIASAEEIPGTLVGRGEQEFTFDLPGFVLSFQMTVITPGTCEQVSDETIHCTVPEGKEGRAILTAQVMPESYFVVVQAVSLPPWAAFQPAAGYGHVITQCTFAPPLGSAGVHAELAFRAAVSEYGLSRDLYLILDVVVAEAPAQTGSRCDLCAGAPL